MIGKFVFDGDCVNSEGVLFISSATAVILRGKVDL